MYQVAAGVRSTHGKDGAVVLDIQRGQMFNLNLSGSTILELLERGTLESEIAKEISEKFGIHREVAENDTRKFIESLKEHHLLEKR